MRSLSYHSRHRLTVGLAPFNVNVRGYTDVDEDMVCLDLTIDFRPSFMSKIW